MANKLPKDLQEALRRQPAGVPYRAEDDAQTPWVVVRLETFERMQRLSGKHDQTETSSHPQEQSAGALPEWCDVYAGLSDDEIEAVEEVILHRADLSRPH